MSTTPASGCLAVPPPGAPRHAVVYEVQGCHLLHRLWRSRWRVACRQSGAYKHQQLLRGYQPARRKLQRILDTRISTFVPIRAGQGILTKAALAKQGIRILQGSRLPFWLGKVIGKELLCGALFLIPCCHAPQALKNRFLAKSQVEQTAVYWVLILTLGILIAGYRFKLRPLVNGQ